MEIKNSVAFVTGANRGLGRHLAAQLLDRGAAKVYAAARNPATVDLPGVVPVRLDVTDPASVAEAAAAAPDVTLLINNAGISTHTRLSDGDLANIRREMETHYFGTLEVTRALAPRLTANGGGAILNILSILSWIHLPDYGAYSASKAAELALTNVLRQELAPSGIDVTALHVGYMDTDMADYVDPANKTDPAEVAAAALDGIQAGSFEVIADVRSRDVRAALSGGLELLYPQVFADAGAA
ncbi:MAG: putative dehydrogenase [Actinoallomurus sp.]|jgi:NAD(P)-dependent dehydrogenase (short-subunit alcohol dehydrogenase family)|nr:putative dehydrogenase [Actinoallomurus sp.]